MATKNITFAQVVGQKKVWISVPETRVTTVTDVIDKLVVRSESATLRYLKKYIVEQPSTGTEKKMPTTRTDKREAALKLITTLKEYGRDRGQMIKQLQNDLEMSYANARHYVVNVAKIGE